MPLVAQGLCVARGCSKAEQKVLAPLCHNNQEAKPGSEQSVLSAAAAVPCCSRWPGPILLPAASRQKGGRSWHSVSARGCSGAHQRHLGNGTPGAGDPAHPHRQDSASSRRGVSHVFKSNLKARGAVCSGVCLGWQGAKEKGEGPCTSMQGEILGGLCHGRRSSKSVLTRSRKLVVLGSHCC